MRRHRIAAGAVLATAGLLSAYSVALRPQPTYASPRGGGQQADPSDMVGRTSVSTLSIPTCASATASASTESYLRYLISQSQDGDVICVTAGITLTRPLPIVDDTTLTLVGSNSSIVIDGDDTQILTADFTNPNQDDTLIISSLTLQNGQSGVNANGGAIAFLATSNASGYEHDQLTMSDVSVVDSVARGSGKGGAVFVNHGFVSIENSSFTGNTAYNGGAVWAMAQFNELTVSDSTFAGNRTAGIGGALYVYSYNIASISRSIFESNYGRQGGGGVYISAPAGIDSSVFFDNSTQSTGFAQGGGAYISGGFTGRGGSFITSSTFVGNGDDSAPSQGGGLAFGGSDDLLISNSTFAGNSARWYGGGVHIFSTNRNSPVYGTTIAYSTIANNSLTTYAFGAGLYVTGNNFGDDTLLVANSVFFANEAPGAQPSDFLRSPQLDDSVALTNNLFTSVSSSNATSTASVFGDPLLGSLGDNGGPRIGRGGTGYLPTTQPGAGSPAIGVGAPAFAFGVINDQAGVARSARTVGAMNVGGSSPNPPTPPAPVYVPSAPRAVTAEPLDGAARVSWEAPASAGSFPVTNYLITAQPSGRTCLVPATQTSCEVTGLTNGQPVTFTAQALNGAGWSASSTPSAPVTPRADRAEITLTKGTRVAETGANDRITSTGSSVGIPAGTKLTPYIRLSGQGGFTPGQATITVQSDGSFRWSRLVKKTKGVAAYVAWKDAESNRVFWSRVR